MSLYTRLFFILLCSTIVYSRCVTYNFESDFDYVFSSNSTLCRGLNPWEPGSYSSIDVAGPHVNSSSFVLPSVYLSCVSSTAFSMEAGGTVEVLLYMDSSIANQLTLVVNEIIPGGNDVVMGNVFLSPSFQNFVEGWQTLRMTLSGTGTYDGYLSFLGMRAEDSIVLIDSFRYIPPSNDEHCNVYEEETTTVAVTSPPTTTTIRPVESEKCFTYKFGNDLDNLFTTDRNLCAGFVPWSVGNHSSVGREGAGTENEFFLAPNAYSSCISSFAFPMSPSGIVEVKVFMEPTSKLDHIIVLAKKTVVGDTDTVAGFQIYEPSRTAFVKGWSVIRISLVDLSSFDGYLIFLGQAAEPDTVYVDSFRYIPPGVMEDDATCVDLV